MYIDSSAILTYSFIINSGFLSILCYSRWIVILLKSTNLKDVKDNLSELPYILDILSDVIILLLKSSEAGIVYDAAFICSSIGTRLDVISFP